MVVAMKIRVPRKPADAYQHGNLREALVQAGLKLLSEGGVEQLSLRAAAQLAGVSHAAPYRHFRDKDALVATLAERGFRLLSAAMRAELARCRSSDIRERLAALGAGYLAFALEHPAYLALIFGGVLSKRAVPPELRAAGDEAYAVLRDTIADGINRRELRAGDPDEVALAAWSLVHGLATLALNGALDREDGRPDVQALGARLGRMLQDGIVRRP
jgi:AcrR family transcriptional regulator